MKYFLKMGVVIVAFIAATNVVAANVVATNISKPKLGLSVSTTSNTMISGKYFIGDELAVLGGFGLLHNDGATDLYLMGGLRKYLPHSSTTFVPFVGARGWYSSVKSSNVSTVGLAAEGGAEYFLNKHFSVEGTVAVGYASKSPTGGSSTSTFGTSMYALGVNFYF